MKDPDSKEPGSTFKFACKPDSVPLPGTAIHLGRAIARRLLRPTRDLFDGQPSSLFGLAPGGVCLAGRSPGSLVGSYPTVSPLPVLALRPTIGGLSLLHFPSGYPAWALPSTVPSGVRTFLGLCNPRPSGELDSILLGGWRSPVSHAAPDPAADDRDQG